MKSAICPGTFDPVTNGHLDVILRAARHFDRVVVGVASNPEKHPLFSTEERLEMLGECLGNLDNIDLVTFDCLLVELAHEHGSHAIVKGLRAMSDFEYEFQMDQFNRQMDESIDTFFVMASPEYTYLSSSGIKEVAQYGGHIKDLVPELVEKRLFEKFGRTGPAVSARKE